jgi:hypothetical protein
MPSCLSCDLFHWAKRPFEEEGRYDHWNALAFIIVFFRITTEPHQPELTGSSSSTI